MSHPEKALQRLNKLRTKINNLLDQLYSDEVIERDEQEILDSIRRVAPEAWEEIVQKLEKRKSDRAQTSKGGGLNGKHF